MICRRGVQALRLYQRRPGQITEVREHFPRVGTCSRVSAAFSSRRHYASSTSLPSIVDRHAVSTNVTLSDSIYALSTAPGRAAIAVVRISGPACLNVYRSLCPARADPKPRTAVLRKLYDPDESVPPGARALDHAALVLYFPAPNTVTGEDILELHIHGGPAIVRSVLDGISKCGRAAGNQGHSLRHAEPGEFTKRAFYNGKLDLTQAEALGETLAAETEQQRRLAISGTESGLSKRYDDWRRILLYARGELEALIDFSEDQHFDESPVEFVASVTSQVQSLRRQIDLHIQNASKGELLRNGISIALLGAPNAGKSSLLNRIVGREAAIVSAEEGTTRDIVDVAVDIGGWLCRLGDMAGLRGVGFSADHVPNVGLVEKEGIRRARERALLSDVVVVLLSVERERDGRIVLSINDKVIEAAQECFSAGKRIIVAVNKIDVLGNGDLNQDVLRDLTKQVKQSLPMISDEQISMISCRSALNSSSTLPDPGGIQAFLGGLIKTFKDLTTASTGGASAPISPAEAQSYWSACLSITHRQSSYLQECCLHLNDYLDLIKPDTRGVGISQDFHVDRHDDLVGPTGGAQDELDIVMAAEHLRSAALCLAKITGKGEGGDIEDVLGVVFEK